MHINLWHRLDFSFLGGLVVKNRVFICVICGLSILTFVIGYFTIANAGNGDFTGARIEREGLAEHIVRGALNPLTIEDVFISEGFTPILAHNDLSSGDILFYNNSLFPNYLTQNSRTGNELMPYITMLYVVHRDEQGQRHYFVYWVPYDLEVLPNIELTETELRAIRDKYLEYLHREIESLTIEDFLHQPFEAITIVMLRVKEYIINHEHQNGVGLHFEISSMVYPSFIPFPDIEINGTTHSFIAGLSIFAMKNDISNRRLYRLY